MISVITNPWVLTPLSIVAYVFGWLSCATLWTRNQVRHWVTKNPGASRSAIAAYRQKEANQETGMALAWPLLVWVWAAVVLSDYAPILVARLSRHPSETERTDLREVGQ